MITPEQMAKAGSEHAHQSALFCWAALPEPQHLYPELQLMFAVPNGGERNRIVAAKLKAEGVKAGVLDIFLPVPRLIKHQQAALDSWYHGMFLEMKRHPNKPTAEQNEFADKMQRLGYYCAVAYSWEEGRSKLIAYLKSGV